MSNVFEICDLATGLACHSFKVDNRTVVAMAAMAAIFCLNLSLASHCLPQFVSRERFYLPSLHSNSSQACKSAAVPIWRQLPPPVWLLQHRPRDNAATRLRNRTDHRPESELELERLKSGRSRGQSEVGHYF